MDETATPETLVDEDIRTITGDAPRLETPRPGDADGTDTQDADGTDTSDADGTDGDATDMTDGDSSDADGTDSGSETPA